ncbi:hypothetical protein ACT0CX_004457, partial [Shigella flexneri]
LIMLPSETMIWQPEFTDKTLSRKPGAVQTYGYSISGVETDDGYKALVRAFQLHFRQKNYDGIMDAETAAILYALLEKYFPGK